MKRSIREFRDSGQLHRHAIVNDGVVVEIHVFDESGNELPVSNPKGWRLGPKGELIPKKSADPTTIGHRNSMASSVPETFDETADLRSRVARLRTEISHLVERIEYFQSLAHDYDFMTEDAMMHALATIEQEAERTLRGLYEEDR